MNSSMARGMAMQASMPHLTQQHPADVRRDHALTRKAGMILNSRGALAAPPQCGQPGGGHREIQAPCLDLAAGCSGIPLNQRNNRKANRICRQDLSALFTKGPLSGPETILPDCLYFALPARIVQTQNKQIAENTFAPRRAQRPRRAVPGRGKILQKTAGRVVLPYSKKQ